MPQAKDKKKQLLNQPQTTASVASTPTANNLQSFDLTNRASQLDQPSQDDTSEPQTPSKSGPNDPLSTKAMATTQALQSGADPKALDFAMQHLGDSDYIGWCEKFVENAHNQNGIYASAATAWSQQQDRAVQGLDGVQRGDSIYFAPDASNANDGHAGIYSGNGNFISATAKGVKEYALSTWSQLTGQEPLGYIPAGGK